ncbi:3-methyl-2-oxobutanoate dehydrogenase subunit VorB [bacterium]|nr:3-methyl-2-oxobutanoate dehydrogenase subunit VorB [bacterium]
MGEKKLMKGNDAMAAGVIRAGCRFFAGYPITPQNEVPEYMAREMPKAGGSFVQAESEIAAINMLFGSAACGVRSMTSSSSPGISLKQEGISYIAGAELPILFANVARGGPGLGNIAPAQSDYFQATRGGGHGDYRTIVLAPSTASEMANFCKTGFDLAEKYRMPACILADGVLGQMMEPVEFNFDPVDPKKLPKPDYALGSCKDRKRRVVRSYDLRPGKLEEMNWRFDKKYKEIQEKEVLFEEKNIDDADIILCAYGSTARICKAAMQLGRKAGYKVGYFRPITLWPFPYKRLNQLADNTKRILTVEMSLGQMIDDVKIAVEGKSKISFFGRPGGGIPTPEQVMEKIKLALEN